MDAKESIGKFGMILFLLSFSSIIFFDVRDMYFETGISVAGVLLSMVCILASTGIKRFDGK